MKKQLIRFGYFIFLLQWSFIFNACTKTSVPSTGVMYSVDNNIYFTATFSGKTIKTNGIKYQVNNITATYLFNMLSYISSYNNYSGGVTSNLWIDVEGSTLNLSNALQSQYNIPVQQCNASIYLTRTGNAVGIYQTQYSYCTLTDLTAGNKQYNIDASSIFTVTNADATYVQGTYSGNLIDGSTKIPVTGTFKLLHY